MYPLVENEEDRWRWTTSIDGFYSTMSAYELLIANLDLGDIGRNEEVDFAIVWNKIVPLKVTEMTWRLLKDRLPTRTNLELRRILAITDTRYPLCGTTSESVDHLFLQCKVNDFIWKDCFAWMGIALAPQPRIRDHFLQFSSFLRGKRGKIFSIGLWVCVV